MEIPETVIQEPKSSISVIEQESLMPVSEEARAGSSLSSHLDTLGEPAVVSCSSDHLGSSPSLPPEAEELLTIAPRTSQLSVSLCNTRSKTLDDYTLVPSGHNPVESFCRKTLVDDALPNASAKTLDNQPHSSLQPSASTLDEFSLALTLPALLEDRHAQEGEVVQCSPFLFNDISDYLSLHWSSPWSPPKRPCSTLGSSLSSNGWPSLPSSSLWSSREEKDSMPNSENYMSLEDIGAPLTNMFSEARNLPSIMGAGLRNLGNTCYMNAILQCLVHTVLLIQGLRSCDHSSPCDSDVRGFCVLCALRELIELSLTTSGGVISPTKFVDNLNFFSSCFRRYQQEDAHEFMQCFLEKLERCFLDSVAEGVSNGREANLVRQIFGGRLLSKLQCSNCGHCSDTYEPLIDLSLEIENVNNLTSALESFTKVEKIDVKFRCDSCKEEVFMQKQLALDQTPSIATFHLKRFKTTGTFVQKIDRRVDFPLELDLQPYTTCNRNNCVASKYELYAIVEHVGFSSTSGHYFCLIRSSPDTWYRLDDSKVSRTFLDIILSKEAYILFYAREGTPWFESIMEAQRPCLDPRISRTSPTSVLDNADVMDNSHPKEDVDRMLDWLERAEAEGLGINDIIDSSHSPQPLISELMEADAGCNGHGADTAMITKQVPPGNSVCLNENLDFNELIDILSSVEENDRHQEIADIEENEDGAVTPPSSPRPNVYSPDMSGRIPHDHLKTGSQENCQRSSNESAEDSQREEALGFIKSTPDLRSVELAGAELELQSGGVLNKRRKREESSM